MSKSRRPSLRVPFCFDVPLDSEAFASRMRVGDLELAGPHEAHDVDLAEWRSTLPGHEGSALFARDSRNPDLGCTYFTGPRDVDLALRLVNVIPYVPAGMLHLTARACPERGMRIAALRTLAQVYMIEDRVSYWDRDVDRTVREVSQDPDADLRRRAFAIEVKGNPHAAARDIKAALEREIDPEERRLLEALLSAAEDRMKDAPKAPAIDESASDLRYAIPFFMDAPADDILQRFTNVCSIEQRASVPFEGAAELVELKANDVDARLTLVMTGLSELGVAYYSGSDAALMAFGFSIALSYLPSELAKIGAQESRFGDQRARCFHALALAHSGRIAPLAALDPDVPRILERALSDRDPEAQAAAKAASVLLRDEIARTRKP